MMKHQTISIRNDNGTEVLAQAPLIISASRATDIPAFYADWFFRRLDEGYIRWRNPFSGQDSYVSFKNSRFIVFWSKNPKLLLPYLSVLKERGIGCYIQFTLNDYEAEGLEPNIPPLEQRIETFRSLVDGLGIGAVVWRFDPLIFTDKINIDTLLEKIAHIADALDGYAENLVFSFADIASYKKVSRNLHQSGIDYREWAEGLEPNIPPLEQRIETFRSLVDGLGIGAVVWRFDPLIFTDKINIDTLLEKIAHIADALDGYAENLVFSFADIASYKKVSRNLHQSGIDYREWDEESMREFASRLSTWNRDNWNFRLTTCAERIDLSEYGIEHNRCIDPELISRLSPEDIVLQNFLYNAKTDNGQRKACGCILSKDIGAYNTCPHGCLYCYANTSPASAGANYKKFLANPLTDIII